MEKRHLEQRVAQMTAEGTQFRVNANVGENVPVAEISDCDAVVLAGGATAWRDLPVPGRELSGIYQAMEFLPPSNHVQEGDLDESPISAKGKHVVIIGGGDTGADCLGTSIRQGAATIHQFEILPRPPEARVESMPWPTYPMIYRVSSATASTRLAPRAAGAGSRTGGSSPRPGGWRYPSSPRRCRPHR